MFSQAGSGGGELLLGTGSSVAYGATSAPSSAADGSGAAVIGGGMTSSTSTPDLNLTDFPMLGGGSASGGGSATGNGSTGVDGSIGGGLRQQPILPQQMIPRSASAGNGAGAGGILGSSTGAGSKAAYRLAMSGSAGNPNGMPIGVEDFPALPRAPAPSTVSSATSSLLGGSLGGSSHGSHDNHRRDASNGASNTNSNNVSAGPSSSSLLNVASSSQTYSAPSISRSSSGGSAGVSGGLFGAGPDMVDGLVSQIDSDTSLAPTLLVGGNTTNTTSVPSSGPTSSGSILGNLASSTTGGSSSTSAAGALPHQPRSSVTSSPNPSVGPAPSSMPVSSSTGAAGNNGGGGSALAGDYGLLGLLGVIRMSDEDRNALALGSDLTTLGLNLNSSDQLYSTFASPWSENPTTREPQYQLPMCYYMQPPALKTGHLSKFQLETLFYIFYALPKDVLQAYAAQELYSREWRYHVDLKLWFKRAGPSDGVSSNGGTATTGASQYIYFDIQSWEHRLFSGGMTQNVAAGLLPEDDVRVKFPNP